MTEYEITRLLADRHSRDVFIPQCRMGSATMENAPILDGWAMTRSWANFLTYGYEIKVHRSDFLRDAKWMNYLGACHLFYFVCPSGLIDPSEIPEGVGLLWVAKTGTRLFTKKKAPHREAPDFTKIMIYVLMWRAVIGHEKNAFGRRMYYEKLVDDHRSGRRTGRAIARILSQANAERERENQNLSQCINELRAIDEFLRGQGVDTSSAWSIGRARNELSRNLGAGVIGELVGAARAISKQVQEHELRLESILKEK